MHTVLSIFTNGDPENSDESNSSSKSPSSKDGTPKKTYVFKSSATPSFVKELAGLESDWWKLIRLGKIYSVQKQVPKQVEGRLR